MRKIMLSKNQILRWYTCTVDMKAPFPKIETLLDGRDVGYEVTIQSESNEAFGEYDPELLKTKPRTRFLKPLEVGM